MKKKFLFTLLLSSGVMGLQAQQRPNTPIMGWSSWNSFRVHISDSLIENQANLLVEKGLKEAGYVYVNIDDGFWGGRNAEGNLKTHPEKFPMGFYPTVDYIHSLGLKAGIYSDAGKNTCGSFWDHDHYGVGVGMYGHELEDAEFFFKDCGFDYIKIDFCGGDPNQNQDSLLLNEKERYTSIRQAIDSVGCPAVPMGVCRWAFPGTWASEMAHSWRIAHDIAPSWSSVKQILRQNKFLSAYVKSGAFNDMDMLEIGRGLSEAEERTHFGMWCMMSSPLLIGCDLARLPEKSLSLLKNKDLIAIDQDILALQAYQVRESHGISLFVKDLEELMGRKRVVALCNTSDEDGTFSFNFSEVDLTGSFIVVDVFSREIINLNDCEKMDVVVPAHDTRIFMITASKRLERTVYEAETAWMKDFQCLINPIAQGTPYYEENPTMSGGGKVCGLGTANSGMEWQHVYIQKEGTYDLSIDYVSPEMCDISCCVNDGERFSRYVCSGGNGKKGTCHFRTKLQKGFNKIRLFSRTRKGPEIDVMRLSRIENRKR